MKRQIDPKLALCIPTNPAFETSDNSTLMKRCEEFCTSKISETLDFYKINRGAVGRARSFASYVIQAKTPYWNGRINVCFIKRKSQYGTCYVRAIDFFYSENVTEDEVFERHIVPCAAILATAVCEAISGKTKNELYDRLTRKDRP